MRIKASKEKKRIREHRRRDQQPAKRYPNIKQIVSPYMYLLFPPPHPKRIRYPRTYTLTEVNINSTELFSFIDQSPFVVISECNNISSTRERSIQVYMGVFRPRAGIGCATFLAEIATSPVSRRKAAGTSGSLDFSPKLVPASPTVCTS